MLGPGQKPSNKQLKFLNLLILVHLKNYFIEILNKFLMCFEINGLKKFSANHFDGFLPGPPIYLYYYTDSKNIFIVKTA